MKIFGKSKEEQSIEERAKAREVCQVILDYGINQNQIKHLIYLLALELEDNQLMQEIKTKELSILSIGMSGDYKIAINNGSNMIRIGSAIFGKRS